MFFSNKQKQQWAIAITISVAKEVESFLGNINPHGEIWAHLNVIILSNSIHEISVNFLKALLAPKQNLFFKLSPGNRHNVSLPVVHEVALSQFSRGLWTEKEIQDTTSEWRSRTYELQR